MYQHLAQDQYYIPADHLLYPDKIPYHPEILNHYLTDIPVMEEKSSGHPGLSTSSMELLREDKQ